MLSFMLRKGGLYEGGEVLSRGVTSGSRGAGAVIEGSYGQKSIFTGVFVSVTDVSVSAV